jgi:hypothetical protein
LSKNLWAIIVAASLALGLPGCLQTTNSTPPHEQTPAALAAAEAAISAAGKTPAVASVDVPARPRAAPQTDAKPAQLARTAAYRPAAKRPPKPYVPSVAEREPGRFLTLKPIDLSALLGVPVMIRQEQAARIWQYHSASCVVDLFLYPEGEAASHEVVHIEARALRRGLSVSAAQCFGELLINQRLQQADTSG